MSRDKVKNFSGAHCTIKGRLWRKKRPKAGPPKGAETALRGVFVRESTPLKKLREKD